MAKLSQVEKQKSRLQSEVEVLIIDLEKANGTCREVQKRCEQLERMNIDLKGKVRAGASYRRSASTLVCVEKFQRLRGTDSNTLPSTVNA